MKSIRKYALLLLAAGSLTAGAQSLKFGEDASKAPYIRTSKDTVDVSYAAGFANVAVKANFDGVKVEKTSADADWATFRQEANGNITFFSSYYYDNKNPRYATFRLSDAEGKCTRNVVLRQAPNTSAEDLGDKKITIKSGTAQSEQSGEGIANSFDGDASTLWHSSYGGCSFPTDVTYTFQSPAHVDYMVHTPRMSGGNGCWGEIDVYYATAEASSTWIKVASADCGKDNGADIVPFGTDGIDNVYKVKITIKTTGGDSDNKFASCAEIGFYEKDNTLNEAIGSFFTNNLCYELNGITTEAEVQQIPNPYLRQLALALLKGDYSTEFRVGEFDCYLNRGTLQQQLKTSSAYDNYENPTGIYFKKGEQIVVFAEGISDDYPVQICIKSFSNATDIENEGQPESSYPLSNGANVITAANRGNAYVRYYSDDCEKAPTVKLHFAMATADGYYDAAKHNNAKWKEILANAQSDHIDFLTKRLHVIIPKANAKNVKLVDAEKLALIYDSLIYREREIMGLQQFDREPKNHQFARPVKSGMFADGTGAAAAFGSFNEWINPDNFGFWGMAHELGHVNQITPGFKWSGCGETTNNIYSAWVEHNVGGTKAFGNGYHRLEDENSGIDSYSWTRGGRFEAYLEEGVRKGVAWQLQDGPDYHGSSEEQKTVNGQDADGRYTGSVTTGSRNYDHFLKVIPFWQMTLFTEVCRFAPGSFGKMIESYRTDFKLTDFPTNGKQQIEMMKRFCVASGYNFLPFFEKAGMLKPINYYVEDYGPGWNIINTAMIDKLKSEVAAMNLKEVPAALNYINAYNYDNFRNKVKLTNAGLNSGCTPQSGKVRVDNEKWKGAVGYETYNANGELLHISMFGLGDAQMSSKYTYVLFPSNASYIMAVGYDGTKVKCYQK